jgi:phosphoribosylglycinamide formyltransferase 1
MNSLEPTIALISPPIQPLPKSHKTLARLGVMASGSGSNFEAIVQAIESGDLQAEVPVLIYNNPNAAVVERAQRLGVPTVCLNHREFDSREALDAAIVQVLQAYGVNWVVMAGWMRIVTPVLINAFPNQILNIHPSLLPSFKGGRAIEQAFESGVKITGCTVHYVVPEVDSGAIIMQAAVPILATDTLKDLQQRLQAQEHKIYPRAIAIAIQERRKKIED